MDTPRWWLIAALFALGFAWNGYAHNPIVIDGGPTTVNTAYEIADVDVSRVAYHERTAAQPEIWLTFQAEAGKKLYLRCGVPKIDRSADLRPAMALFGPGLPAIQTPFTLPDGYGGLLFSTEGETPEVFDEAFTGTLSWQFAEHEPTVEQTGRYYVVGYIPSGQDGKFWVATGTKEVFGWKDILNLPSTLFKVRAFHEIGPFGGILFWVMLVLIALAGGAMYGLFRLLGVFL